MDNFKVKNVYGRLRLKYSYKTQQAQKMSELFDKATKGSKDKGEILSNSSSTSASQDTMHGGLQMRMAMGSDSGEMEGTSAVRGPPGSPSCALFVSPDKALSHPKKSKPSAHGRQNRAGKKTGRKGPGLYSKLHGALTPTPAVATLAATSTAISPEYPSIETFRDLKPDASEWSHTGSDADVTCGRWLNSLTDKPQPEQSSLLSKSLTPTAPRQHSFVKIRTPVPVPAASDCSTLAPLSISHDEADEGSSSYTSMYTWVTATGTTTGTTMGTMGTSAATTGVSDKGKQGVCQKGEGEVSDSSGSPTLVQVSQQQDPLQSTAIHPHLHPELIQETPHLSPIRGFTDEKEMNRTPSGPAHHVSPRGPRKAQSFLVPRKREVHPKCSTVLFSSMANSGDAPFALDVSSIKAARESTCRSLGMSEAMNQSERDEMFEETVVKKKQGQTEGERDRVLTSTPCGDRSRKFTQGQPDKVLTSTPCRDRSAKFTWNLSSVQLPEEDEEEPLAMNCSNNTVNSEEIVADTPSDISFQDVESDVDLVEKAEAGEGQWKKSVEAAVMGDSVESGVEMTSQAEDLGTDSKIMPHSTPAISRPAALFHSASPITDSKIIPHSTPAISRPAALFHSASPIANNKRNTSHFRSLYEQEEEGGAGVESEAGLKESEEGLEEAEEDWVPACPVSTLGMSGTPARMQRQRGKARLLMRVEPADSGFHDMMTSPPPDIVGVVSQKVEK